MKTVLQDFSGRPARYANVDGTGEMNLGLMMLGFALLDYLYASLPGDSRWRTGAASFVFMYGILGSVLALGYFGAKAVKRRITWPRTGYVAYSGAPRRFWTAFLVGAVASAGFATWLLLSRSGAAIGWERAGYVGCLLAAYTIFVVRGCRGQPWKWLVVAGLGAGLLAILVTTPGSVWKMSRPVCLLAGLTWLGSGAVTLGLYIRHTQPPAQVVE